MHTRARAHINDNYEHVVTEVTVMSETVVRLVNPFRQMVRLTDNGPSVTIIGPVNAFILARLLA